MTNLAHSVKNTATAKETNHQVSMFWGSDLGSNLSTSSQKNHLRKKLKEVRKKRSIKQQEILSSQITELTLMVEEVMDANTISLYSSVTGEPSTFDLLKILKSRQKNIIIPILGDGLSRNWAQYVSRSDLQERVPGRPLEPSTTPLGEDAIRTADVILAPALAVDTNGNRLGLGGGWYDRVLTHKRPDTKIFALIFDEELLNAVDSDAIELPHEAHDIPVNGVITPSQILRF